MLFRPTSLRVFELLRSIGLIGLVNNLRAEFSSTGASLGEWVIYSVPDALWTFSVVLFFGLLWRSYSGRASILGMSCASLISILTELLQKTELISGTFDRIDIGLKLVAIMMAFLFITQTPKTQST